MRKLLIKPGFEAIYTLSILLLIILPAMVFAGQRRTLAITRYSDTIINGRKLKILTFSTLGTGGFKNYRLYNDTTANGKQHFEVKADTNNRFSLQLVDKDGKNQTKLYYFKDTSGKESELKVGPLGRVYSYSAPYDNMPTMHPDMRQYRMPTIGVDRNTFNDRTTQPDDQDLSYHNTDKDGISTNMNFHIAIPQSDVIKKLSGAIISDLDLIDLLLVPEFSSGQTLLTFTLPAKIPADVKLTNSDGKTVWTDRTISNKFIKTFSLPVNGVYYLVAKQGGKVAVRKIVRE